MAMNILNEGNFKEEVLSSKEVYVVDFYADWCGPCKMMAPQIDELSEEMSNVKFGKCNVDENQKLAIEFNIQSIPNVVIIKDGAIAGRSVGFVSKEELKAKIDEAL